MENHESSIVTLKSFENYLFSGGEDGKINIWKIKDWNLLHSLDSQISLKDIAIHNSGKIMIVCGKGQKFSIWDLTKCEKIHHQKLGKGRELISEAEKLLFSPN